MKKVVFLFLLWAWSSMLYAATPIEIVVPFPAGGPTDVFARAVQKYLTVKLNNTAIVVSNKPGADGKIAVKYVLQKPADGNTLVVFGVGPFVYAKAWYNDLGYDYSDFDVVVPIAASPLAIMVNSNSAVTSLEEFIALARDKNLNCGSSSPTSAFASKYFIHKLGLQKLGIVPYKGDNPVMLDLLGGHIDCGIGTVGTYIPAIRNKTIRVLAVASAHPEPMLPGATLLKDTIPNFVFTSWFGIGVIKTTPPDKKSHILEAKPI